MRLRFPFFRLESFGWLALILCLAAVAIRAVQFGNPVVQWDEQFYLVVGDRIWAGDWPYVAAWDRKPVGLFLTYAAARGMGGDGILAYQLLATASAAATAVLIARMAAVIASPKAALASGILYLLLLMANGGDGGQAPVFYNVFVAAAAMMVVRVAEGACSSRKAHLLACGAMASFGIALQIKYSVLFEGVYFGVALLVLIWRRERSAGALAGMACLWIALALAPTLVALLAYVAVGDGDAFVFANFLSIFQRSRSMNGDAVPRLLKIVLHTLPAVVLTIASARGWRGWRGPGAVRVLLLGWSVAAVAGLLLFGTYHDHYALPLLVPLAVCAAPVFDGARTRWLAALAMVASAVLAGATVARTRGNRGVGEEVRAIAARVGPAARQGLFVLNGDPILYLLAGAVPPTRWYFPTFLSESRDSPTLGTDPYRELGRIMATHPRYVVARDYPFEEADATSWKLMQRVLQSRYCLVGRYPLRKKIILLYEDTAFRNDQDRCLP